MAIVLTVVLVWASFGPLAGATLWESFVPREQGDDLRTVAAFGAATVMGLATAWRKAAPVASAVVVYLGALAHLLVGVPFLPVDVLVLLALYSVTVHSSATAHRLAIAGALAGSVALPLGMAAVSLVPGGAMLAIGLATAGMSAGTWGLGLLRRASVLDAARAAELRRLELAEREREARMAVTTERTRIAREMHDVVAHTLSVVIAQADGGRYAAAQDPAAAERALATIAEMGRGALADIRRILGVLRDESATTPALVPQPVDDDLDRLVQSMRDVGLEISIVRVGEARPLPAGAGLMLYRIAQEALTNVLKHAGPAAVVILHLRWTTDRVVLMVDDDGRGAAATSDGKGQGLVGMRERAGVLGGTVEAGPRRGGGFRVRVDLPVGGAAGGTAATGATTTPGGTTDQREAASGAGTTVPGEPTPDRVEP
jgi:signal transduction histidine kinase